MPTYNVYTYALVHFKTEKVEALSPEDAAKKVYESTNMQKLLNKGTDQIPGDASPFHIPFVEFSEEVQDFQVDQMEEGKPWGQTEYIKSFLVKWKDSTSDELVVECTEDLTKKSEETV